MSDGRSVAVERLRHMLQAADAIAGYVDRGRAAFDTDPAVRDAILYQLVILGEAAKVVIATGPGVVTDLPEVEWSPIARMRDRIAHHYWTTDSEVVWSTATIAVPELRRTLAAALARLT